MAEPETSPAPDEPATAAAPAEPAPSKTFDRVFLVVIDETPELAIALRYACIRARKTGGRVALLYVIEPPEFTPLAGISQLMEEESRQAAEQLLQKRAAEVQGVAGSMPVLYVRQGQRTDELMKLLAEEPGISILVLGAATGSKGPGPLVSALTTKYVGQLRVPVTIVPGSLTPEDLDKIC